MNKYECTVIYVPGAGSDLQQTSTQKYTDVIASNGGKLTGHDDWGKRGLAYEIDHNREGFYHFYKFEGGGETVDELNRQLRIDENVLRHMIVRDDYVAPPPRERREPTEEAPAEGGAS